jgi:hypothetical protein
MLEVKLVKQKLLVRELVEQRVLDGPYQLLWEIPLA